MPFPLEDRGFALLAQGGAILATLAECRKTEPLDKSLRLDSFSRPARDSWISERFETFVVLNNMITIPS